MPVPILPTKLYIPLPRPNLVQRRRLLDRLDEGLQRGRRLSVVCAPPGFGKTTLATSWLYSANLPVAARAAVWLSIDAGDNDPARLAAHVIAALQQVDAGIGRTAQALLGTPEVPPLKAIITSLVGDLAAVDTPFILVLDDYQLIRSPDIRSVIDLLLANQPPSMHLLVTTREEPPLALSRLRARDEVTEIGPGDLRFTRHEAEEFLQRALSLPLSAEQVDAVTTRTEGWVAGLQLLSLALQHKEPAQTPVLDRRLAPPGFGDLSGNSRYVADYLATEVLAGLPNHVRAFLRETCILDHLTALLCNEVTGRQDSEQLLKDLDEANLFTIALDDRRDAYRYHRLFAEVLRDALSEEEEAHLHRKAMN